MTKTLLSLFLLIQLFAQSHTGLKLGGTLMNGKDGTRAIVELGDGRTTQVCEAGKSCLKGSCDCEVAGYKVLRIEPRKVTLQKGAERFIMTIDGIRSGNGHATTIKKEIARNKIAGTMQERPASAHAVMYRLFAEAGLQPTDQIRKVQGLPVTENMKWGTVFGGIQATDHITVEIERNGAILLLELNVTH